MSQYVLRTPCVSPTAPTRLRRARASRALARRAERRARTMARAALLLFALVIVAAAIVPNITTRSPSPVTTRTVRVERGDTLWDVASAVVPQGGSVADVVRQIRDMNDLETSSVPEGMLIEVPVTASSHVVSR